MTAKVNAREPIRCPACIGDGGERPRTLAEVVIADRDYDVWAPRRRRRRERVGFDSHAGVTLEPPGMSNWRRVDDGERLRCGRQHHGTDGVVTIDAATIGDALRRAAVPADLPRVVLEPPLVAVFVYDDPAYLEAYRDLERERDDELALELFDDGP